MCICVLLNYMALYMFKCELYINTCIFISTRPQMCILCLYMLFRHVLFPYVCAYYVIALFLLTLRSLWLLLLLFHFN